MPDAENIADMLLWLGSSDAGFFTGEIFKIDDGYSLTTRMPKPI